MKKLILIFLGFSAMSFHAFAQDGAEELIKNLEGLPDQFNEPFETKDLGDKFVLIYIPGANDPFQKIYFKKKASNLVSNTLLIGAFGEMNMGNMSLSDKKKHLQEALAMRYKKGSLILMDMESEIGKLLELKGYAIITVSKKQNKILEISDFGFDRVSFFNELKKYEQPEKEEDSND